MTPGIDWEFEAEALRDELRERDGLVKMLRAANHEQALQLEQLAGVVRNIGRDQERLTELEVELAARAESESLLIGALRSRGEDAAAELAERYLGRVRT